MDSLIFSLNATMPVFAMMVVGMLFRLMNLMDRDMAGKLNTFVFKALLPVMLFGNVATVDIAQAWDTRFVLFCFIATLLSVVGAWAISRLMERSIQGEFIQASYRSSAAVLGAAFIQNIYGEVGIAPLMVIASVPVYNAMGVVVLSVFNPNGGGLDRQTIRKTLWGIVTNPLILGILVGILWSLLHIPMPTVLGKTVSSLGGLATPLGLITMGATFDITKVAGRVKPLLAAAFLKLVGFCAMFLPIAVAMGYRQQELVAILVMLGSATTISCFVMAKNMGHEAVLSASAIMLTTLLSAFTMTLWLWLLHSLGLI